MNEKIPVGQLSQMLAQQAGISQASAELFIKTFFDVAAQALISGERLKIKGLGEFDVDAANEENPVTFTPDADLAAWLNAPFAEFEPEVIGEEISDEALDVAGADAEADAQKADEEEAIAEDDATADEAVSATTEATVVEEVAETAEEEPLTETAEAPAPAEEKIETKTEPFGEPAAAPETPTETPKAEIEAEIEEAPIAAETPKAPATPAAAAEEVVKKEEKVAVPAPPAYTPEPKTVTEKKAEEKMPTESLELPEEDEELMVSSADDSRGNGPSFGLGVFIGLLVGLALGACIAYFAIGVIANKGSEIVPETEEIFEEAEVAEEVPTAAPDQAQEEPTADAADTDATAAAAAPEAAPAQPEAPAEAATPAQEEKPVIEVVQANYNLAKMARKHYGEKSFWVYIFEENRDKLKSPDDLKQGMKLVIPPASKYNIDAKNPASVKAAKEKEKQLFARQKK